MPETLAEALLEVQRELKNPTKSHTATVPTKGGGNYSYNYASLDDTLADLLPLLNAAGITLLQPMASDQYTVGVRTVLRGYGEEVDLGTLVMPTNPDPQKVGAIITYLRRYALGSIGLVAEDDTDGANMGDGRAHGTGTPPAETPHTGDPGAYVLPFGKHKGKTLRQAEADSAGYAEWVVKNIEPDKPAYAAARDFLAEWAHADEAPPLEP